MPIMYERCAGVDVQNKIVLACVLTPDRQGGWSQEIRTFGTMTSGEARKGNRFLRITLVQAAHAAARTKGTYLSAQYRRLAARRGNKRAIVAVAHSMLVMAYDMIQRQEPYRDAEADFFDRLQPEDTARRLVKRLESLGYHVTLQSASTDAMP